MIDWQAKVAEWQRDNPWAEVTNLKGTASEGGRMEIVDTEHGHPKRTQTKGRDPIAMARGPWAEKRHRANKRKASQRFRLRSNRGRGVRT